MPEAIEKRSWFGQLDAILRGEATRPSALKSGTIQVPVVGLTVLILVLGMAYGVCMGSYAVSHENANGWIQLVASALKVPALFLLTLLVTFPSLYVFNALVGSRLGMSGMVRLLLAAMGVTLAVLASLGTITAFFSVITESYSFVVVMNVAAFAVSGFLGLGFLLRTLDRLSRVLDREALEAQIPTAETPPGDNPQVVDESPRTGALERPAGQLTGREVKLVFSCWVVLFGLVGAQMSWVLRPFIGSPEIPFTWLRPRQSNFFEAVFRAFQQMFSGG